MEVAVPPLCIRGPNGVAIACVPKVAHTSIESAVLASYGLTASGRQLHCHPALQLCHAAEAAKEGRRIFAFVRNPFDRLVSVWADKVARRSGGRKRFFAATGATKGESFARFVARLPGIAYADVHLMPQVRFVPASATVFRFEALAEGWEKIRRLWPGLPPLGRENESERAPAEDYAEPHLLETCRKVYRLDYERFGYA